MNRCPNCKSEILFENAEFCEHCGVSLQSSKDKKGNVEGSEEGLDFEVSESIADQADDTHSYAKPKRAGEDLGVQTSAEWVERQSLNDEQVELPSSSPAQSAMTTPQSSVNAVATAHEPTADAKSGDPGLHRLSADEVKKIEQRLYSGAKGSYLSEEEKRDLIKNMKGNPKPVATGATPPPIEGTARMAASAEKTSDLTRPQVSKRSRGVANYVGNWIQVQGGFEPREMDEIVINDRAYLLKKKRLSPKTISIVAGSLFVILLFVVGSMFVSSPTDGKGELIGIVLDDKMQPIGEGATVRVADLGLSFSSNGQGFFRTDRLPVGSHKLEYVVNGQVVGTDYATVTAGQATMVTLRPTEALAAQSPSQTGNSSSGQQSASSQNQTSQTELSVTPASPARVPATRSGATDQYGRIALQANVDGARFALNGGVLGAGNLTYSRIKPGKHNYTVSADGYQPVSGTIDVAGGETQVLAVELSPATVSAQKPAKSDFDAAVALLKGGQAREAVTALTAIIDNQPSNAAAYATRADANLEILDKKAAHDDYIKAAEIYRAKNNGGQAMTAYNNALKVDPQSVTALLGRGSLHLEQGEEIAAITDYESVVKIDKRNAQAYYGLGESRYSQGNYNEAIKHFKDARSLDPNNPDVYQYLMLAYMGNDDLKNVKKSYEKFKEIATQDQMARFQADKRFGPVLRVVAAEE